MELNLVTKQLSFPELNLYKYKSWTSGAMKLDLSLSLSDHEAELHLSGAKHLWTWNQTSLNMKLNLSEHKAWPHSPYGWTSLTMKLKLPTWRSCLRYLITELLMSQENEIWEEGETVVKQPTRDRGVKRPLCVKRLQSLLHNLQLKQSLIPTFQYLLDGRTIASGECRDFCCVLGWERNLIFNKSYHCPTLHTARDGESAEAKTSLLWTYKLLSVEHS